MAMNPPPTLLGPSGQPVQIPSNWVCLVCGDRPKVQPALQPQIPGAPECIMTKLPEEAEIRLHCAQCWNRFWANFTREHAPALVPIQQIEAKDDAESR